MGICLNHLPCVVLRLGPENQLIFWWSQSRDPLEVVGNSTVVTGLGLIISGLWVPAPGLHSVEQSYVKARRYLIQLGDTPPSKRGNLIASILSEVNTC